VRTSYIHLIPLTETVHCLGTPNCPCLGDQPLLGADANGFYVATNEFSIAGPPLAFNGAQVYAMSKHALVEGNLRPWCTSMRGQSQFPPQDQVNGGLWYSIQPATSPGAGEEEGSGTEYFLSAYSSARRPSTTASRVGVDQYQLTCQWVARCPTACTP